MSTHASAIAAIRTGVAALVGMLAAFLLSQGVELPEEFQAQLIVLLSALASAGYNALVIYLERNVHPMFGVLLGIPRTPAYEGKHVSTENWHLREPPDDL